MKFLHFDKKTSLFANPFHITSSRFIVSLLLLVTLAGLAANYQLQTSDIFQTTEHFTVVLDAGHGGDDPGKVSTSGIEEKDINLAIALKCRTVLAQNGISIVMTRETDCSLEDSGASNKKASDLQNRRQIITDTNPDCAVSIHQNSYPDNSQYGAQVFYQTFSSESEALASCIQNQLPSLTGAENKREIKSNSDYYLLRDNGIPTVIAEICFLSNPSEAELIADENIQEKAAFAVAMGIMKYLYSQKQ